MGRSGQRRANPASSPQPFSVQTAQAALQHLPQLLSLLAMANADQPLRVMRGRGEEGELTQRDVSNRWKRHRQRLESLKVKSPEWICAKCGASNFMQGPNTKTECRSCYKDGDATGNAKGWLLLNHYEISKTPARPLQDLYTQLERLRPIAPSTSASSQGAPLMKPPPPLPSTPPQLIHNECPPPPSLRTPDSLPGNQPPAQLPPPQWPPPACASGSAQPMPIAAAPVQQTSPSQSPNGQPAADPAP
eukprot:6491776-Amphidinium_carterae.1